MEEDKKLIAAATVGDVKTVKLILDNDRGRIPTGLTSLGIALTEASRLGHTEVVRLLLEHGAHYQDPKWESLTLAIRGGHLTIVELLLQRGARLFQGRIPEDILELFFEPDTGYTSFRGLKFDPITALFVTAIQGNHVAVAKDLINKGFDKHKRDARYLDQAINSGHVSIVELLLNAGAASSRDPYRSPLITAVRKGSIPIVQLLLSKGFNINNTQGMTFDGGRSEGFPLIIAVERGDIPMLKLLLDRGANIHAQEDLALRNVIAENNHGMINFLLDRGADVHALNDGPLRQAIIDGRLELVRLLLDRGADVNADPSTPRIWTAFGIGMVESDYPLALAVKYNHPAIAELLLSRGADGSVLGKEPNPNLELIPYSLVQGSEDLKYYGIKKPTLEDPYWYFTEFEESRTEFSQRSYVINGIEFDSTEVKFFINTAFEYPLSSLEGPYEFPNLKVGELRKIKAFLNGLISIDELDSLTSESLWANKSLLHWSKLPSIRESLRASFDLGVPFFEQKIMIGNNPFLRRFLNTFF